MFGEIRSLVAQGIKGLHKAGELLDELPRDAHGKLEDKAIALYLESALERAAPGRARIEFKESARPRRRQRYNAPAFDFTTSADMLSLGEEIVELDDDVYALDWGGVEMDTPSWMLWSDGVITQGSHRATFLPRLGGIHDDMRALALHVAFDFSRPEQAHIFRHYKAAHGQLLRETKLDWQTPVECEDGDVWHLRFAVDEDYGEVFVTMARPANDRALEIWVELNPE